MKSTFHIRTERQVPLEELELIEACVLPDYFIEAETPDEALEEVYWHAPIVNDDHFKVDVVERVN